MSPDNYAYKTRLSRRDARLKKLTDALPNLSLLIDNAHGDFRGLSLGLGRQGGWLLILRRFGSDGRPEVQFWGGEEPLGILLDAEDGVDSRSWKEDTWAKKK